MGELDRQVELKHIIINDYHLVLQHRCGSKNMEDRGKHENLRTDTFDAR